MIILGLDISSASTGYAIYNTDHDSFDGYGVIKFSGTGKNKKTHPQRLGLFEEKLLEVIEEYSPEYIYIEDIWGGNNKKTYKILALYHGIAYKIAYLHNEKDPIVYAPSAIRKLVANGEGVKMTEKGRKDKEIAFEFIVGKYSYDGFVFRKHNDITDAMTICLAGFYDRKKDEPL